MIYTEETPNPNALKFVSEKIFSEIGVQEFQQKDKKAINNDFIKNLLKFEGVELILVSKNFISVKKDSAFRYVKEIVGDKNAILEFESELNGKYVNGIDLISWNEEGKITEFKVFIRPLQAVNTLHEMMGKMLERMKG